jgi:hypothetical protein
VIQMEAAVVKPRTVRPSFEDDTRAKKADAGHDALRHTCWVNAERINGLLGHPFVLVHGHEHEQG